MGRHSRINTRRLLGVVVMASSLIAGGAHAAEPSPRHEPSAGDLATARIALKDGLALREKGDLEAAAARLTTAFDLVQTPVTGFELGKTQMMLGRVHTAHELFQKVVRLPPSMEESSRSATARQEAARLAVEIEPRIPQLAIKIALPKGATAVVRVDDDDISMSSGVTARVVDPGAHVVTAKAGDGPEQRVNVEVAESQTKSVDLAPQWIAPKAKPVEGKQVIYVRQTNPLMVVGFTVASAGLVVTGITLGVFFDANAAALDACAERFCPESARAEEIQRRNTWAIVSLGAGLFSGAAFAVGMFGLANPKKEKIVSTTVRPYVGLGGAGVEGRF